MAGHGVWEIIMIFGAGRGGSQGWTCCEVGRRGVRGGTGRRFGGDVGEGWRGILGWVVVVVGCLWSHSGLRVWVCRVWGGLEGGEMEGGVGKWRVHKVRDLCLYLTCYGVLSELKGQAYGETEIMECLTSKTKDGCSFCE